MSAADRRFAAATVGSLCEALPVVFRSLSGPLGDNVRAKLRADILIQGLDDAISGRNVSGG